MTPAMMEPFLVTGGLLMVRCGAFFLPLPVVGGRALPARVRAAVAVLVALVLVPLAGPAAPMGPAALALAAAGEMLLGAAMGLAVRLVLVAADLAGEVAGMQMGFAFSRLVDPLTQEPAAVTTRIMGAFAVLLFIAFDGPHMLVLGLGRSVQVAPPGTVIPRAAYAATLMPLLGVTFSTALRIAAPVMVALLLANGALGLLARTAPQLHLFILGLGISIGVGMVILQHTTWPGFALFSEQLHRVPDLLDRIIGVAR